MNFAVAAVRQSDEQSLNGDSSSGSSSKHQAGVAHTSAPFTLSAQPVYKRARVTSSGMLVFFFRCVMFNQKRHALCVTGTRSLPLYLTRLLCLSAARNSVNGRSYYHQQHRGDVLQLYKTLIDLRTACLSVFNGHQRKRHRRTPVHAFCTYTAAESVLLRTALPSCSCFDWV
jgi:hypothetical protein